MSETKNYVDMKYAELRAEATKNLEEAKLCRTESRSYKESRRGKID
ncbi:MAG: hypothetical protein ACYSW6_11675 [Planctomycetota bacterium]